LIGGKRDTEMEGVGLLNSKNRINCVSMMRFSGHQRLVARRPVNSTVGRI